MAESEVLYGEPSPSAVPASAASSDGAPLPDAGPALSATSPTGHLPLVPHAHSRGIVGPRRGQRSRLLEDEKLQLEVRFLKLRNKNLVLKNKKLYLQITILEENLGK